MSSALFARRKRVPVRLQMDATECGAACLAMILSYFGRDTTVRECRERCAIGRDGMTADVLVRTARSYELDVRALSLAQADLGGIALPAVVHWNFAHFIVVEQWRSDTVDVVDPAIGPMRMSRDEFDAGFTGVVLVLQPGATFSITPTKKQSPWRDYLRYVLRESGVRTVLLQLLGVSLLLQILGVALPVLAGTVVDRILPLGTRPFSTVDALHLIGIAMLCFVAAQTFAMFLRSRLLLFVEARLDLCMMPSFMRHLLSLPLEFFQRHRSGDLLMRLGNNVIVRDALASQALSLVLDSAMLVVYLTALLFTDALLGSIAVAIAVVQVATFAVTAVPLRRLTEREVGAVAESQSYAIEALNAVATVKACGAEDRLLNTWTRLFHRYRTAAYDRSRLAANVDSAVSALRLLAPVLLIWVGALRVAQQSLTVGGMMTASMLAASLLAPLAAMIAAAQRMQLAKVHLERIVDVRTSKSEQDVATATPLDAKTLRLSGRIELDNVSFRFDPHSPPMLTDIALTVRPGQKVALVGRTGCGKTTLAMLMLGLYRPSAGAVRFDGVDLRAMNLRTLRSHLGVVMQEAGLFSGSIRQNLAFFDSSISLTEIIEAAQLAEIHDDIMHMPMGYETRVADGGAGLSGGQRQRLCLARALVRKPSILLLDEATSHLDVATEAHVDRNLDTLDCTRIVIAHRLSTIRTADVIVVLDQGRILDTGTHRELLSRCTAYAQLVRVQALEIPEPQLALETA